MFHRASRPFLCAIALAIALALALAGCGGGGGATLGKDPVASTTGKTATPGYISYIATAKSTISQVPVFDTPDTPTPSRELENPWLVDPEIPTSTVTQVFLVKQQSPGWVEVLLPVRPNGSTGWVKSTDVTVTPNPFAIKIELGAHKITVTNADKIIYSGKVAVGATDPPLPDVGKPTPTPTGEYYLRVLLQAPDPTTVYGPFAYGLSSHSDSLDEFAGGDAEIGIHGNNDASVLGTNATHGCVRMDNAAITMLSKQLPLGTPVNIVA